MTVWDNDQTDTHKHRIRTLFRRLSTL